MKEDNRFLNLSIIFFISTQSIFHALCAPSPQPAMTSDYSDLTTTVNNLEYEKSIGRSSFFDRTERFVDRTKQHSLNDVWKSETKNVHIEYQTNDSKKEILSDNSFKEETNIPIDENLADDDDAIDDNKTNIDEEMNRNRTFERHADIQNDSPEISDEHSEIDNEHSDTTTMASIFDNLNFTLPSLSRMIDMSEQGELDILNKTQPRRLQFDVNTNEEVIGLNDFNKILIGNDLNSDERGDFIEDDVLNAPGEDCGRNLFDNDSPLTERIIGGKDTYLGEIPWIVSIRLKHPNLGQVGHWCASVLINLQWVATASHCIINPLFHLPEPMHWEVRLGKHNISKTESTQKTYQVSKLFHIKQYRGYDNDLALLKLQTKVETNEYIKPICLPLHEHFDFSNAECQVAGWGKVDYNKKGSDILQKVKVNVYENIDCQRVYYPKFRIMIKNWHLCAGNKFGGKGTCHGDSGGPLQCRIGNRWYLAGVTSFGSNCAKYGFPDVFTKITYFLDWIKEKIKTE